MPKQAEEKSTLALDTSLKHAEVGYRNAQDVIKFLDTKSGVIAGFAFVGIGFILQVVKAALDIKDPIKSAILSMFCNSPCLTWLIYICALLSLFFGIASIWCVVRCVTARAPKNLSKLKHTVLFPFCDEVSAAKVYYQRIRGSFKPSDIAAEYEHQILNVGSITCAKMRWNRRAAFSFLAELAFLVAGVVAFLTQVLTFPR